MKRRIVRDGMYEYERVSFTRDDTDPDEFNRYMEWSNRLATLTGSLEAHREEARKELDRLVGLDGPRIAKSDEDPAFVWVYVGEGYQAERRQHAKLAERARRIEDLKTVLYYCDVVEKAFSAEQWENSTLYGVQLGIAAHKAFRARPLEPEVLRGRAVAKGAQIAFGTAGERAKRDRLWRHTASEIRKEKPESTVFQIARTVQGRLQPVNPRSGKAYSVETIRKVIASA